MTSTILNVLLSGTASGAVLAFVGVGFVCLFRATGVLSLANGYFMTLGAMLFYTLWQRTHVQFVLSLLCAVAALGLVGLFVFRFMFARLQGRNTFVSSIATLGLGLVIQAVMFFLWSSQTYFVPNPLQNVYFRLERGIVLTFTEIWTVALAVLLAAMLGAVSKFSRLGREMRALSENAQLAAYWGVRVNRIAGLGWAVSAGAAAIAGVVFVLGSSIDVGQMPSAGLVAIPAIFLGGLDSVVGAVIGGIAIGLFQAIALQLFGGEWQDIFAYACLLLVIAIRPEGLFGSKATVRL